MLTMRTTAIPEGTIALTLPTSVIGDPDVGRSDLRHSRLATERALDEALAESFPASDPPSWTPGVVRPDPVPRASFDRGRPAADPGAPLKRERTFLDGLMSLAGAGGIALLVPVAILLVMLPIALVLRGVLEAFSWLLG